MYAQLDNDNICFAYTSEPVQGLPIILCQLENLGQKYNHETGEWEEQPLPIVIPEVTNEDVIQSVMDLRADLEIKGLI